MIAIFARNWCACLAMATLLACRAGAADETVVRKVIGRASAKSGTALPPETSFSTASKSKSELAVRGGVVRTGASSEVKTLHNGIALTRGVTLVAGSPGGLRKTVEVRAPGYRLKVRGTAQIAFEPGRSLKVVVLEGSVTVGLDSILGEFETLQPGQMLIVNPSDHQLPEPVEVDLQRLVATSALVNGDLGGLPTSDKIMSAGAAQGRGFARGRLNETPLVLSGVENSLIVQDSARTPTQHALTPEQFEKATTSQGRNDFLDPNVVTDERPYNFATGSIPSQIGDTVFSRNAQNVGRTKRLIVRVKPSFHLDPSAPNGIAPDQAPQLFGNVTATRDFFAGSGKALQFQAETKTNPPEFGRLTVQPNAFIHSPNEVGLTFVADYGMDVTQAKLQAGLGTNPDEVLSILVNSAGLNVTQDSYLVGGDTHLQVTGGVTVDHSKIEGRKNVRIGIPSIRTDIVVRNSSELSAIAGSLDVLARRGSISLSGSTVKAATQLQINADNSTDPGASGLVTIQNSTLMADVIRVRGYSDSGDALLINGSTFNANQLLKLYAEGASTLRFQGQVSLNTALAILAGKTVEVELNGAVNISGKAQVYTDQANYNKTGFGNINAGGGLFPGGFSSRPKF